MVVVGRLWATGVQALLEELETALECLRLAVAADPLGLHLAASALAGSLAVGSVGISCQSCSGMAGDLKATLVTGWNPPHRRVHTVRVPGRSGWQGLLRPTQEISV